MVDFLFVVAPIAGVCNCSMFCWSLLNAHSSIAIILKGKRELVTLLNLSSWCLCDGRAALPRGARGLSAVCDCGISASYSLTIFGSPTNRSFTTWSDIICKFSHMNIHDEY